MQLKQTDLDASIQRLIEEGYEIEMRQQHFLVHSVPYVKFDKTVDVGVIACPCPNPTVTSKPPDHTVWFIGGAPSNPDGTPLGVVNHSNATNLGDGIFANHYFSNKPENIQNFPNNYYEKIVHYVTFMQNAARAIDNNVNARTGLPFRSRNENAVFKYGDYSSMRSGIYAISQKLEKHRIAIIGLGGTGGYILDQIAKTPVREIHLYDDDVFGQHNAFRAPGAPTFETLEKKLQKVDYFKALYEPMRNGIHTHPYRVTIESIGELKDYDFVFVAVDNGDSRKLISTFLKDNGIPFIDVGMGINKEEETLSLYGGCRTTFVTPNKNDHIHLIPVSNEAGNDLYRQNIQVADLNAMNALLAVIKWKQHSGFYKDDEGAHEIDFTVTNFSNARSEKTK